MAKVNDNLKKQVEDQVQIWATNRKLYPGWVIAPHANRVELWLMTERWIDSVLEVLSSVRVENRIRLLFELNWRLETAMVPLWQDLARVISETLEAVNPYPDLVEMAGASLRPAPENVESVDWQFVRDAWSDLGFAVLRSARELQDASVFEAWLSRLMKIENEQPCMHSRLRYQQCLFSLSRMDHAAVRNILSEWKPDYGDPFQDIRRGAVLAEIGELDEAEKAAVSALAAIRDRIRPLTDDLPMLSREGWAMLLVRAIKFQRSLQVPCESPNFSGRWEKLAEYKCNPHADLDLLEAKLKQPTPSVVDSASKTEEVGFDPEQITRTYHIGSGSGLWDKMLPALQAVRVTEEGGCPPSCGYVSIVSGHLLMAAEWLQSLLPQTAMSILMRIRGEKGIERFFTRHRIASLSAERVAALHATLAHALSQVVTALSESADSSRLARRKVASEQARVAIELLSRVVVRLPPAEAEQELDRAIQFYRLQSFGGDRQLAEVLGNLFKRVLKTVPKNRLSARLPELVSLPIPGVDGFTVDWADRWPDPASMLPRNMEVLPRADSEERWSEAVKFLLKAARCEGGETRKPAMFRLHCLCFYRVLTDDEQRQFADSLWKYKDAASGLPKATGLYDFAFLQLPEPSPGVAMETFKRHYLMSGVAPFGRSETQPDGTLRKSFQLGFDGGRFFEEITNATRQLEKTTSDDSSGLIDWTLDEVRLIFGKITEWWKTEGKDLCSNKRDPFLGCVQERVEAILGTLRLVIIPRCPKDDELVTQVVGLVHEIENSGTPIERIMPSLIRLRPDMTEEVAGRLRKGLAALDKDRARAALAGLRGWLLAPQASGIPSAPPDLLHELASIVSSRRSPVLVDALYCAAEIVNEQPEKTDHVFLQAVCVGLQYLLEETRYRETDEEPRAAIPYKEVPRYRAAAAHLAAALLKTDYANDPAVQEWRTVGSKDPLPEVRRVFGVE